MGINKIFCGSTSMCHKMLIIGMGEEIIDNIRWQKRKKNIDFLGMWGSRYLEISQYSPFDTLQLHLMNSPRRVFHKYTSTDRPEIDANSIFHLSTPDMN